VRPFSAFLFQIEFKSIDVLFLSVILESLKKQSAQAEPEAVSQAVPSATAGTMLEQFNRIRDMLASGQISAAEADELRRVEFVYFFHYLWQFCSFFLIL
jgi:mannose/fructose/N-acetylgalactosamine-specific phosphotransferase system component IIC